MKTVCCFSKNTPSQGRFHFLQEKRRSSVWPVFHPALAVSWFWLRERLCLNICPWRDSGLDYASLHRSAGRGRLQSVAGAVGQGRWCPTIREGNSHHIPLMVAKKVPFSMTWSSLPFQPRLSLPLCWNAVFSTSMSTHAAFSAHNPPKRCLPKSFTSASFRCHLLQEASPNCQAGDIPPLHLVPQSPATVHLWPPTLCTPLGQGRKFNQLYFQPQCLAWGRCSKYLWDVERCHLDV